MDFTPENPTVVGAQAHLDQLSAHRDDLTRQVTDVWATMPPEARDFAWARLDDDSRLALTADTGLDPTGRHDTAVTNDEDGLSTASGDVDQTGSQDALDVEYGRDCIDLGYLDDADGWG